MGRIVVSVKIGDQITASGKEWSGLKDGMPIQVFREDDYNTSIESVLGNSQMLIAFANFEITEEQARLFETFNRANYSIELKRERPIFVDRIKYRAKQKTLNISSIGSLI